MDDMNQPENGYPQDNGQSADASGVQDTYAQTPYTEPQYTDQTAGQQYTGQQYTGQQYTGQQYTNMSYGQPQGSPKSKIAAGLLGIFLGGWGIHRFYLGYTTMGIIQIVVTLVTCGFGSLWGFVEGIMILCGSTITTDAKGNPLEG